MRDLPELELNLNAPESFGNVAKLLTEDERKTLATDLMELINIDEQSMSEWLGRARGYLENVEADEAKAPQNREQQGAGEQDGPPSTEMTLTSVIQFSARATDALLGEPDLAKASEPGGEPLAAWVSKQLRTNDPNWTLDTDPLVVHMAVTGLSWRKRSFDEIDRTFHSHFLTCEEVIVNKKVKSVERAPRITHQFTRYPYEINRSISRGHWIDYDPQYHEDDPQAEKKFYEIDLWLDLDGDGNDEPWTIVISRDDIAQVIKIIPRWSKKSIVNTAEVLFFKPIFRFYPYRFLPDPKGGFFPMGFGKLLDRTEQIADRLLAAIIDTAETESSNGGVLAGGGTGLPASEIEVKTNRVTTVETDGRKLSDMFQPWPMKSVSQGSVSILDKVITLGDRLSGTLNLLENAPASMTATLAKGLIDNGTQVQSAVHRRIVTSMTQEFRMFVQMADAYDMLPAEAKTGDLSDVAVTADPQLATEMHRSALANIYFQMIAEGGGVFVAQEAAMRFCTTMRIPNPEKLIAPPQGPPQPTPYERIQGAVALQKASTEKMKILGGLAVQMTQSVKNLVDAGGGMVDIRSTLLQMAQLEAVVQSLVGEAGNAGTNLDSMAQQSGNPAAPGLPPPSPGGDSGAISGGAGAGASDAGAGGGGA